MSSRRATLALPRPRVPPLCRGRAPGGGADRDGLFAALGAPVQHREIRAWPARCAAAGRTSHPLRSRRSGGGGGARAVVTQPEYWKDIGSSYGKGLQKGPSSRAMCSTLPPGSNGRSTRCSIRSATPRSYRWRIVSSCRDRRVCPAVPGKRPHAVRREHRRRPAEKLHLSAQLLSLAKVIRSSKDATRN